MQKLKNNEARPKFTGSYNKSVLWCSILCSANSEQIWQFCAILGDYPPAGGLVVFISLYNVSIEIELRPQSSTQ